MNNGNPVDSILNNKYEVKRLIGQGGMGAVYEAKEIASGRRIALKLLHSRFLVNEESVARFQREAKAAAAVGHENIIEIIELGRCQDGRAYIAMELLEGKDLKTVLVNEGPLPTSRAANIAVQALVGLQAAHGVGVIHRDLKPENIFLVSKWGVEDFVKILDFGISKIREPEDEDQITETGIILGTPRYMSPEQARGDRDLSPKSDIYSMGVILYQMVTGRLPYNAPNFQAQLSEILTREPPSPISIVPSLPPGLVDVIKWAMERDKEKRIENCFEFRKKLAPFAVEEPAGVDVLFSASPPGTWRDRREEIQNIGFASNLKRGDRNIHVQTEVTVGEGIRVKTTVLNGGAVLDAIVSANDAPQGDVVVQTEKTAKAQHEAAVNRVEEGAYD